MEEKTLRNLDCGIIHSHAPLPGTQSNVLRPAKTTGVGGLVQAESIHRSNWATGRRDTAVPLARTPAASPSCHEPVLLVLKRQLPAQNPEHQASTGPLSVMAAIVDSACQRAGIGRRRGAPVASDEAPCADSHAPGPRSNQATGERPGESEPGEQSGAARGRRATIATAVHEPSSQGCRPKPGGNRRADEYGAQGSPGASFSITQLVQRRSQHRCSTHSIL